jgi:integrase
VTPAGQPALPGSGTHPGLLGKLIAAIRPEFRAEVLVFGGCDPLLGDAVCRVQDCSRAARNRGLCEGHRQRWQHAGQPDLSDFASSGAGPWHGHAPLPSGLCRVPGCGFGVQAKGLCPRHAGAWRRAGKPGDPDPGQWAAGLPAPGQQPDVRACVISYCEIWAHPRSLLCWGHHCRWKKHGRPDQAEFARAYETPRGEREHADLSVLPRQLRLELQYALQCRSDDRAARTRVTDIRAVLRLLAGSGRDSLLALDEQEWRGQLTGGRRRFGHAAALLSYAYRQVSTLAEGDGWDNEYPRDTWHLRRLGITAAGTAALRFGEIPQPWLKELAKRWTRWRISTGLSLSSCSQGLRAVIRFAVFLDQSGVQSLSQVRREMLERYLAALQHQVPRAGTRAGEIGQLSTFLTAIHCHGWDTALPANALLLPGDYPARPSLLPRALAEHVMAQTEDPVNLARWHNPAYHLITVILMRCGLRISSAIALPWGCIARDAAGAPYLRYYNTKMKREALVPIDEELRELITGQHDRIRRRWPDGTSVLFPSPNSNTSGSRHITGGTYRANLYRWLDDCDIRDEHGQPARLTPHQWRHILSALFPCRHSRIGGQADLRPSLAGYLLLAAACRGTT